MLMIQVAATISQVNCSAVSPQMCSAFNRAACTKVPNTCGPCNTGFIGTLLKQCLLP